MSQESRKSSRPSSVIKREELEEKLAQRKADAEIKVLKAKSKALESAARQELKIFQEEARRLSELVDRIYDDSDPDDISNPDLSLEWDSHECSTSPSFITIDSSKEVSPTVQDIIEDILNSSVIRGEEEHLVHPRSNRRNTSTDNNFLSSSPVERQVHFNWPPRFPSQEPEDYNHFYYPPLQLRLEENQEVEEVFEAEQEEQLGTMDPTNYEARLRVIKVAAKKVRNVKKLFLATDVTKIHIHTYESRLKEVRDELKIFNDAVADLTVDLDEDNGDDKVRITNLENLESSLLEEVKKNEKEVAEKVSELLEAQPLSKAEAESLDLQRKKFELEQKKIEDEKILKGKKADIAVKNLSEKIKNLMKTVKEVKPTEELSDQEIKHVLPEAKKWESRLEELTAAKVKLDMELIGLNIDAGVTKILDEDYMTVATSVKEKLSYLTVANEERRLFALNKQVKDIVPYPEPFHGKPGENIFKFFEKMREALDSNQVPEKNRADVLRKHLGGGAKGLVDDCHKTLTEAEDSLIARYGSPKNIWNGYLETFKKKCSNPKAWSSLGSSARCDVIAHTIKFLNDAKQLAEDYQELKSDVYSEKTVGVFHLVLPDEIIGRAYELDSDPKAKNDPEKTLHNIKTRLELDQRIAGQYTAHVQEIEENKKSFSIHVNNFKEKEKPRRPKMKMKKHSPDHDCRTSNSCKTKEWAGLGCSELYKLHTVEERQEFLKERNLCFMCGRYYRLSKAGNNQLHSCIWKDKNKNLNPAKCSKIPCKFGAATCPDHQGGNASKELKDWLNSSGINSTVTSIFSFQCKARNKSPALDTNVSGKERSKLQSGQLASDFTDDQIKELFENDLKNEHNTGVEVRPIPEGEVAFIFCKIKGKKNDVQAFIDNGCNCAIVRDGIPQEEFRSCLLREGPIRIDVATGVKAEAQGEWATALPMNDGSFQAIRSLSVTKVTSDMPTLRLKGLMKRIKEENKGNPRAKMLKNLNVPSKLGGEIDAIIGIQFKSIYPEEVLTLPSGLTIYKSKFLPANKGELACIGGPLGALDGLTNTISMSSCVRYLSNLCSNYASGYTPKIDFFPSSKQEMNRCLDRFTDKTVPGAKQYIEEYNHDDEEFKYTEDVLGNIDEVSDEDELPGIDCTEKEANGGLDIHCNHCDAKINQNVNTTAQTEMKKFLQQQEAGLDSSFKCIRCRDCKECLKGAGQERMSIRQEAEQQIIKESVHIDKDLGRAVAKLPFMVDPADKLVDNSRVAAKRLENVTKKYSADPEVREMLEKSMKKLLDNGHIVLLDDLPPELRQSIKSAASSYTIPADVAFKEGSVSTPARWVFDAGSKTSQGYSLNDLLAKGTIDMVRLVDMVMDWRMGPSAFCGDIRQFYNTILLSEEHWKYQKVLLRKFLDSNSKILTGIIKTLIYGVKPVGNQCEEVIRLLVEEVSQTYPEVCKLLVDKRYVDDFGQSTAGGKETEALIKETSEVLGKIKMKVKGWAESGVDPPTEMSDDGTSVGFAGMTWFPKGDFYKLNIQSLHFSKKKRGKFPSNLVKYEDTKGISIDEYTPEKITRTNCTSVTARIYDIQGLLAPLTLKLKNDLRTLISFEPSWTAPIPDHQRATWINNFKMIEEVRDILYVRCTIPTDAVSIQGRILLLCDAANPGIILAAYVCYERKNKSWSCDLLFGKGLLAPENWTIPQKELHGMSALSNLKKILQNSLGDWVTEFLCFGDSEIVLSWIIYEKNKLTTFVRNRVVNIREKMGLDNLYHVEGLSNPTDVGTRPDEITADSVKPGSVWLKGKPWMNKSVEQAKLDGIIKHVDDIRLSNDKKKTFGEGVAYDSFDTTGTGVFAVTRIGKIDREKVAQRILKANYIYPPLKRNFKSLVLVTGFILEVVRKWKRSLTRHKILKKECSEADLIKLDLKEPTFSLFTSKGAMEVDDTHDAKEVTNTDSNPKISRSEHLRRIKEASHRFLNVSEKLERVCPLKLHFGYALYDCGAVCDYSGETGSVSGNKKSSKKTVFSAAYSTTLLSMSSKVTKKGSPNPDPEAWKEYYESRAFERRKVLDNDEKLKESSKVKKIVSLGDKETSRALEYLYKKATIEVKAFNDSKYIKKIAVEKEDILYCKSRLLESAELRVVGHLKDTINLESFTGVKFKVPVLDKHSPLSVSVANYLHYVKYQHKGAESLHRLSLQFCNILGGKQLFNIISNDCMFCKKLQKKLLKQIMGPLADSQLTISPVFYYTLVDLWGPLKSFVPGYEKLGITRATADKSYNIYIMVFVCAATGTVNCQVIEGKSAEYCMDGFNRFFCETTVPKIVYTDAEGGLLKALKEGEVDLINMAGNLRTNNGILFETCVPQGHSAHGKVEKKIHLLQQALERSEIRNSRCTATGWMCIAKLIERTVNSIPIGYLLHQSGGDSALLRILTPNNLRLITTGDRAPAGIFSIPDKPEDIMENIDDKYRLWYKVWNDNYLPLIMRGKKWHEENENLVPGDIVYFKLQESAMSANWRIGKVEKVKVGADGCVRQVTIAYTDSYSNNPEDWFHRSVDRPVRNIVKISHIEDTTFMDDINEVHDLVLKMMNSEDVPYLDDKPEIDVRSEPSNKSAELNVDDQEDPIDVFDDETFDKEPENLPASVPKKKKKRRTELENLEITLKGWNLVQSKFQALPFTHAISQKNQMPVENITAGGYGEGDMGFNREGENENADFEFNFVMKENDFDDIYLL